MYHMSIVSLHIKDFFVVLFFMIVTLFLAPEAFLNPFDVVIGDSRSDIWDHLWGHYRTEKSILTYGKFPFYEGSINYPNGGNLYPTIIDQLLKSRREG